MDPTERVLLAIEATPQPPTCVNGAQEPTPSEPGAPHRSQHPPPSLRLPQGPCRIPSREEYKLEAADSPAKTKVLIHHVYDISSSSLAHGLNWGSHGRIKELTWNLSNHISSHLRPGRDLSLSHALFEAEEYCCIGQSDGLGDCHSPHCLIREVACGEKDHGSSLPTW